MPFNISTAGRGAPSRLSLAGDPAWLRDSHSALQLVQARAGARCGLAFPCPRHGGAVLNSQRHEQKYALAVTN